jgi:MFS transporter, DHA2 family, multidrug resistance protein
MAYPTTLALIAALWSGPARTKAIALWSAGGGGIAALGPLVAGALLEKFWWGSVFLNTLPLAGVALLLAIIFVPSHVNESTNPVDNLGGVLSIVMVGTLILAINFAPVSNRGTLALGLAGIAVATAIAFVIRQRRAANPLYDLHIAARRVFWVAACAGIIVFGSLMGSAFVSQQYLQNVNGYSTLEAGAAFLPAVIFMNLVAPSSAKLVETRGARFTLLTGYVSLFLAFAWMLLLWSEGSPYWQIAVAYAFIGIGVGFAGTPASHSLTGSVPVQRAGMASGTADLQRDLGGAVMQSIFGALLTAGYVSTAAAQIAASPNAAQITDSVQAQLTKSFASAQAIAERYPQYSAQIIEGAKSSFLSGADWAYTAGIIAIVVGAAIVFFLFPKRDQELHLLATYHAEDTNRPAATPGSNQVVAASGGLAAAYSGGPSASGVASLACAGCRRCPRFTASTMTRAPNPMITTPATICPMTRTRVDSAVAVISPNPTVAKTVTVKYKASVRVSGSLKLASEIPPMT